LETIRKATADDAETLARISRETFDAAFGELYDEADLKIFIRDNYAADKARRELLDPEIGVWLLEVDDRAVGYVLAGPCKLDNPEVTSTCQEIHRLYLLPDYQSGGRGARLMEVAMRWLERDRPRRIWLGVFSGNPGAQRFYERLGFKKVGEHTFKVGEKIDHEFTYRRE
jgi:ribosomal protein S18 acetylase RimI-like enzyme